MCNFWDMYPSGFNSWACFSGTGPTDLQTISKMPWSVVSRTGWRRSVQDQWWWPQIGGGLDWSSMMLRNFRNVITDLSWIMDPIKRSILSLAASFRYFYLFFETWFDLEDLLSYDWHPTHTHTPCTPCIWFIKWVKCWSSQIWSSQISTPYMKSSFLEKMSEKNPQISRSSFI